MKSISHAVILAALFTAGPASAADPAGTVIATVDGSPIYASEIKEAIDLLPPRQAETLDRTKLDTFVENYITWKLLAMEAQRLNITQTPEFAKRVELARNDILISLLQEKLQSDVSVSENEAQAYYLAHKTYFRVPEARRARHILVTDEKKAGEILKRLKAGAKFDAEARLNSEDKVSAAEGGDIGWQQRGEILPEFSKVLFSMKSGELLDKPLKTRIGWHLIKLEGIQTEHDPDFKDIQNEVMRRCTLERRQKLLPDLVDRLKEKSKIHINTDALKSLIPAAMAR